MVDILVADDDSAIRSALKLMFSAKLGLEDVQEVTDWKGLLEAKLLQAGFQAFSKQDPQNMLGQRTTVILLDWELPGFPAKERLSWLKPILAQCKVIALSTRLEARQEALNAGVDAFIAKSDPPERVIEIIRRLVENCS